MSISNDDLRRAQQAGATGNQFNTKGLSKPDKDKADAEHAKGKYGQ